MKEPNSMSYLSLPKGTKLVKPDGSTVEFNWEGVLMRQEDFEAWSDHFKPTIQDKYTVEDIGSK